VTSRGLSFHPVRGDAEALLRSSGGTALAESGRSVVRMAVSVLRTFGALARQYGRDFAALDWAHTDLIINQLPGGLYGVDLAQAHGLPMLLAAVMPLVPSRTQPMLAFPTAFAGLPGYNMWTHRTAYQIVWQGFRRHVSRWRKASLGLPPAPLWGHFGDTRAHFPTLNGFSAHVVERPPDWGAHVHVTGYWLPTHPKWQPPDDLCRFIEAGPPPVFIGFGSMPVRDPQRTTALLLQALLDSGHRAILHAGWAGLGSDDLPSRIYPLDYAPYDWLFPRMAAVVHHGGSGTTAFALRAGVPSLVVPFLFDQFYWGARVRDLGVGPAPIPFRRLSAPRLSRAISHAADDPGIRRRAAELGRRIAAEDGIGAAVRIVEAYGTQ
jgi:UDP:flavonoid glycosyltransferase YjiC (YdhE family)